MHGSVNVKYCYAFVNKYESMSNKYYNSLSVLCLAQALYNSRAFAPAYVTVSVVCLAVHNFSYLLTTVIFEKKKVYLSQNMCLYFIYMFCPKIFSFWVNSAQYLSISTDQYFVIFLEKLNFFHRF